MTKTKKSTCAKPFPLAVLRTNHEVGRLVKCSAANVGPKSYHSRCLRIDRACRCVSAARLRVDGHPRSSGIHQRVHACSCAVSDHQKTYFSGQEPTTATSSAPQARVIRSHHRVCMPTAEYAALSHNTRSESLDLRRRTGASTEVLRRSGMPRSLHDLHHLRPRGSDTAVRSAATVSAVASAGKPTSDTSVASGDGRHISAVSSGIGSVTRRLVCKYHICGRLSRWIDQFPPIPRRR